MKARIPYKMSNKEHKAMMEEIHKQIAESDKQHASDIDKMVLYTLHVHLGFGKKRLRRFWEAFISEYKNMVDRYEMPEDYVYLCDVQLKQIGINVDEWNKELTL